MSKTNTTLRPHDRWGWRGPASPGAAAPAPDRVVVVDKDEEGVDELQGVVDDTDDDVDVLVEVAVEELVDEVDEVGSQPKTFLALISFGLPSTLSRGFAFPGCLDASRDGKFLASGSSVSGLDPISDPEGPESFTAGMNPLV